MSHPVRDPHLDEDTLLALASGASRPRAAQHLSACPGCQAAAWVYGSLAARAARVAAGASGAVAGCPEGDALVRYAGAPLAQAKQSPLPTHLRSCADCRDEVAALRRVQREVRLPDVAVPRAARVPALVERLRSLVRFELPLPLLVNPRGPQAAGTSPALRAGIRAMRARRFPEARAALRRARRAGYSSPAVDFYLGLMLLEQGKPAAAATALERAARARHRSAETRFFLAQAWLARGRAAEALVELGAVARLAGPHRQAARQLAERVQEMISTGS